MIKLMMLIIELEIITSLSKKYKLPQFQNRHPFGLFTLSFFLHKYFFFPIIEKYTDKCVLFSITL